MVHFYHLHALDWVDIVSALKADPKKTADLDAKVSPNCPDSGVNDFKAVQERHQKIRRAAANSVPLPTAIGDIPAYKLPPEVNLIAVAHYLAALRQQARTARLTAIFGGKNPHIQSLIIGGVTCAMDLNPDRIAEFKYLWKETMDFVNNVYIPDVLGGCRLLQGLGQDRRNEELPGLRRFPDGTARNPTASCSRAERFSTAISAQVEPVDITLITEQIKHSWYEGDPKGLNPAKGETKPSFRQIRH